MKLSIPKRTDHKNLHERSLGVISASQQSIGAEKLGDLPAGVIGHCESCDSALKRALHKIAI